MRSPLDSFSFIRGALFEDGDLRVCCSHGVRTVPRLSSSDNAVYYRLRCNGSPLALLFVTPCPLTIVAWRVPLFLLFVLHSRPVRTLRAANVLCTRLLHCSICVTNIPAQSVHPFRSAEGPSVPHRAASQSRGQRECRGVRARAADSRCRRVSTLWWSSTVAIVVAIYTTFFSIFDLPVFWPVLVIYFIMLFFLTMHRQWLDMKRLKYVPWDIGNKKTYKSDPKRMSVMPRDAASVARAAMDSAVLHPRGGSIASEAQPSNPGAQAPVQTVKRGTPVPKPLSS
jgi:hypothetical protein